MTLNVVLIAVGQRAARASAGLRDERGGCERDGHRPHLPRRDARARRLPAPGREGARGPFAACGRSRSRRFSGQSPGSSSKAAASGSRAAAAAVAFAGAAVVYGLGECFHGPNYGPLVADLAPRGLEGRYWAVSSGSWELGYVARARPSAASSSPPRRSRSGRSPPRCAWSHWPPGCGVRSAARALRSRASCVRSTPGIDSVSDDTASRRREQRAPLLVLA